MKMSSTTRNSHGDEDEGEAFVLQQTPSKSKKRRVLVLTVLKY